MATRPSVVLGARLRLARTEAGLSQADVADALGLLRPSVTLMEHGKRGVLALELADIARLYGVPVASFLEGL